MAPIELTALSHVIRDQLVAWKFAGFWLEATTILVVVTGIGAIATLVHLIGRKFVLRLLEICIKRSKVSWDDAFLKSKALERLVHWVPALVVFLLSKFLLETDFPDTALVVQAISKIYMVVAGVMAFNAMVAGLHDIVEDKAFADDLPLTSLIQVLKLVLYLTAVIIVIATITGKDITRILAGMGVMTTIIMLVFKDSILGLVAGIQLSANKMIKPGDWIEMPKHGADGDVMAVGLTTVKVQNFDKTITTIPTYALISDSFKNWRGMQESEGRRIKRALTFDLHSVKLCSDEMLTRFRRIEYISDYLKKKEKEVQQWNKTHVVNSKEIVNSRRLTNIGTFRAYIVEYLRNNPNIHPDMTLLVRQLAPGENGLPIEIYCFSSDKNWGNYEDIQSDIFDHLLAIAPEFELSLFQTPSGSNLNVKAELTNYQAVPTAKKAAATKKKTVRKRATTKSA